MSANIKRKREGKIKSNKVSLKETISISSIPDPQTLEEYKNRLGPEFVERLIKMAETEQANRKEVALKEIQEHHATQRHIFTEHYKTYRKMDGMHFLP